VRLAHGGRRPKPDATFSSDVLISRRTYHVLLTLRKSNLGNVPDSAASNLLGRRIGWTTAMMNRWIYNLEPLNFLPRRRIPHSYSPHQRR
jgi:hypothetical protein